MRADGARPRGHPGKALVHFIVTVLGAHPIIPFTRTKQPLACVRHLVSWPLRDLARAIGAPFGPLLQVTRSFCAIMVVALVAHELGCPDLRLSPTRVLAHYLPVQEAF